VAGTLARAAFLDKSTTVVYIPPIARMDDAH
jgi:hypothetical protein